MAEAACANRHGVRPVHAITVVSVRAAGGSRANAPMGGGRAVRRMGDVVGPLVRRPEADDGGVADRNGTAARVRPQDSADAV